MSIAPKTYAYYRNIVKGKQFPLAYVDLDLFDANVTELATMAQGKTIRIASKSVRVPALLQRILKHSSVYQGLMCYSPREAVFLSQQGFDDLLMGYPAWNELDMLPIIDELKKGKTIILMIDRPEHITHLDRIARREGIRIPICMDMDMSTDLPGLHFGVWRSSVFGEKEAVALGTVIQQYANVELVAVMGYEAQIAGLGDNVPGQGAMNAVVKLLKGRSVKEIAQRRKSIVAALTSMGFNLRIVNGGGTGSMNTTCSEPVVTEVTVGSGFFSPGLFDNYGHFKMQPSAGYAIEVVRQPKPNIYTCLGGGYVASGEIGKLKQPKVHLPIGATLIAQEGVGEVQTPISYSGNELALGSPVFLRHSKAGELCEHFNKVHLISQGKIVDEVKTNRGFGEAFL
jgi:D-serine deaminase-like pyridoxal phosphate-dependent protein